jgi:hypothetical protein
MSICMGFALAYGVPSLIFVIIFGLMVWLDYRDGGVPPMPEPPDFVAIAKSRPPTNQ